MKLGVVFPQTEIGEDAGGVRAYAQAAEELGFSHVLAYDHVIGANLASRPGWRGPYHLDSLFHEPLVLFAYLAGITRTIEFATGIIILPQRQTVLVAKQAAAVDVLSGGRLRLGVGIGWNEVEYEALGMSFRDRGRRSEEQIDVLRALWTDQAVTYSGGWHSIPDAGINPMPVQRPIPVWMGGGTSRDPVAPLEPVLQRIARLADGWMPQVQPVGPGLEVIRRFQQLVAEYGRTVSQVGIEGRYNAHASDRDTWADAVHGWRSIGASHMSINTMGDGLSGPDEHIERLRAFREAAPS